MAPAHINPHAYAALHLAPGFGKRGHKEGDTAMSGAYCRFCDHRCFVLRRLKDGRSLHLATCHAGMAHDRASCGEDADTAMNPADPGVRPTEGVA